MIVRGRRTRGSPRREGERARRGGKKKGGDGGVAAAGAGRRYKEHYVQRRKTKWERDAQRCPDEWARWGWQEAEEPARRGTMDPRDGGRKDGGPKEGGRGRKRGSGAQRGAEKSAIREANIEEGPTPPVDSGEMNPAKEEESCVPDARPTMCKVAARVF
ncbi:unnamed protein product [Lasius platythorax]|uniref:Uncharacterized protein n=1 Tax=Lasius platythorax TaxID=488582 RepID=A0AAV2N7D7_9HYME